MLIVGCCPKRTILVPARQSQHTSALSAPADTRFLEESATARIPLRCPASCWRGVKVTDEKRCTRLLSVYHQTMPARIFSRRLTRHRGNQRQRPLFAAIKES